MSRREKIMLATLWAVALVVAAAVPSLLSAWVESHTPDVGFAEPYSP